MTGEPIVTVYSKPQCVACDRTAKKLDRHGVPYKTVDITEDAEAFEYVTGLGYQQAPVVLVIDGTGQETHFSGYRPDMIRLYILNGGK